MKKYRLRFELKPFLSVIPAGILFFILYMLLKHFRGYDEMHTKGDAVFWSAFFSIGIMLVLYAFLLLIKDYKSDIRKEIRESNPGADEERLYLLQIRKMYMKICLTGAKFFSFMAIVNLVIFSSDSGFFNFSWLAVIVPLALSACLIIVWLILRR